LTDYDVGYGKPPKHSRFKKGKSGNPAGRPKGSKNKPPDTVDLSKTEQMLLDEAYRTHPVHDSGKTTELPLMQIILLSTAAKAAKGDLRAQRLYKEWVESVEEKQDRQKKDYFETLATTKIRLKEKLDQHRKNGLQEEDFPHLPHPDDIIIDLHQGTARIAGPMTEEQVHAFQCLKEMLKANLTEIQELELKLKRARSSTRKEELKSDIERSSKTLEKMLVDSAHLSEDWPRHWPIKELEQWRITRQIMRDGKVDPPAQLIRLDVAERLEEIRNRKTA
jgi:stress response protein YsnF